MKHRVVGRLSAVLLCGLSLAYAPPMRGIQSARRPRPTPNMRPMSNTHRRRREKRFLCTTESTLWCCRQPARVQLDVTARRMYCDVHEAFDVELGLARYRPDDD